MHFFTGVIFSRCPAVSTVVEEPYELEWVNWLAGSTGAAVCWAVATTFTLWALAEALHYVQKEDLRKIQSKKQLSLRSAVFTLEMPCMSGEYTVLFEPGMH